MAGPVYTSQLARRNGRRPLFTTFVHQGTAVVVPLDGGTKQGASYATGGSWDCWLRMRDDMKRWLQRHTLQGQRGGVLLEALIAVTLLSTVLTMAVQSSATGSRAVSTVHELNTAQNIARSQLEYALNEVYWAPPYGLSPALRPEPDW
jgi:hypothetical protein